MEKNANDRDSLYLTTRLLRETLESVDRIRSNLLRIGTHALPVKLQQAIADRQIDVTRLNRSAIISIGVMLVEELMESAGSTKKKDIDNGT